MTAAPVLMLGDCLERMAEIPAGSVDMVLADLPYGLTRCAWDSIIPLAPLWDQYRRVVKPDGAIVLTASQPFAAALVMSNPRWFRYDLIWGKDRPTGHLNANRAPLRSHEAVLVFSQRATTYNPQKTSGHKPLNSFYKRGSGACYGPATAQRSGGGQTDRFPRSILAFPAINNCHGGRVHPTQKPEALLEYLIRTYTDAGETVLDNAAGSFSTGIACLNSGRRFIGIERDPHYFAVGSDRIRQHMAAIAAPELEAAD